MANHSEGHVELIEKGKQVPFKKIDINLMNCSLLFDGKLFIGSQNKLMLLDVNDFSIIS